MISYIREGEELWDVPVVVYCVWTLVLLVSSLIVLSCLNRETKKFNKRLARADNKLNLVKDIPRLESLLSRFVRSKLGLGVLASLANSFDKKRTDNQDLRAEIRSWFQERIGELKNKNYNEKTIKRTILAALRAGLTKNPLDLRGSRLSLEGAKIFLQMEKNKEKIPFLQTAVSVPKNLETGEGERTVCPTIFCDWVAARTLKFLSLLISHPNTTPLLFAFLSFCVWLFDTVTDMAIIDKFWNFRLPILYPKNDSKTEEITYLSYQTLTIDLYAPLLLLILLFSIIFTLLSCSCSRLSDKYRIAAEYVKPEREVPGQHDQDPTTLLARYDFNIASAVTSSLPQFSLQFAAYIIILYMLETLKGLSVDQATKEQIADKVEEFSFASLWLSGIGSGAALIIAQYTAFKIQHEHGLTLAQRSLYMLSCVFNTISMMCSCLILVVVVLLPAATFVGRYHIMAIVILGSAVLGIGFVISAALAGFGLDPSKIKTDRIITVFNTDGLLTSFLSFTQTGEGKWRTMLGATTLIGRIFSLLTINLFLPPSQLLIHPFLRFYSTSPRSPALHYAIAKQIIYYNILTLISSIMLCVDIDQYGFNYNITPVTRNLLIYANICGVPCLFSALFILFKFYSSYDLWSSNGVHLVYLQESLNDSLDTGEGDETTYSMVNHTTVVEESPTNEVENIETEQDETDPGSPGAESTQVELDEEQNESTEADRMTVVRKQSKVLLKKQTQRLNRRIKRSCLGDCVVDIAIVDIRGKWVDVSDFPLN